MRLRVLLGGVERALGDVDGGGQAADRQGRPLVGGQLGLLGAGGQHVDEAVTQLEIFRLEIGDLIRGDRLFQRGRQLHAGRYQLQRVPRDFGATGIFDVGKLGLRRDLTRRKPCRNDD
ncbi:hypothetical protein ES707_09075 [subsurface metagenome]